MHLWQEFGRAVYIKQSTLDKIAANFREVERCFTEMLAAWFKGEDSTGPTWGDVICALKSPAMNKEELAQQLIQKLRAGKELERCFGC